MKRRQFLTLIGGVAAASPLAARAQVRDRIYRLGSLHLSPRGWPHHVAFYDELRRQGFVEGQNLVVDERGYGLRFDQIPEHASELAQTQIDVIICAGDLAMHIAQQATRSIPVVGNGVDLVGSGVVASLARPGGNVTGVSFLAADLDGKRQEILMQAMPAARRMAVLAELNMNSPQHLEALQEMARMRGVELSVHRVRKLDEIPEAIEAAKKSGAEALNVLSAPLLFVGRGVILPRVAALRLPAIYEWAEIGDEGGFLAYGPRLVQIYRDIMARQVVRVLRGTKPEDIPVEQPTKFELVVNLKTAAELGVKIPESLLSRADKVIE